MNHPLLALVSTILDHNQSNIRKLDLYQTQLKDTEHYSPAVSPHDQSI